MNWHQPELMSNHTNQRASNHYEPDAQKPVEVYLFMDPFSKDCWSLESCLRKLTLEYGRFFTVRAIVSSRFTIAESESPVAHPWIPSLAIKASELQGKRAGKVFLRKLQEKLFIEQLNISDLDILLDCATEAKLDIQEFENDLESSSAKRAYQCDLRLTNEMDVDKLPTAVFFNQSVEEHGIKVSGLYSYEVYELVLQEVLQYQPIPSSKPPLEDFIAHFSVIRTEEIATIYDWSEAETLWKLNQLHLDEKVDKIERDNEVYWIARS